MKKRYIDILLKVSLLGLLLLSCKQKKEGRLENQQALETFDANRLKLTTDMQLSVTKYDLGDRLLFEQISPEIAYTLSPVQPSTPSKQFSKQTKSVVRDLIWQFNQSYGLGVLRLSEQLKLKTYSGLYGNFDYEAHILDQCFGFFVDNLTGALWIDGFREDIDLFLDESPFPFEVLSAGTMCADARGKLNLVVLRSRYCEIGLSSHYFEKWLAKSGYKVAEQNQHPLTSTDALVKLSTLKKWDAPPLEANPQQLKLAPIKEVGELHTQFVKLSKSRLDQIHVAKLGPWDLGYAYRVWAPAHPNILDTKQYRYVKAALLSGSHSYLAPPSQKLLTADSSVLLKWRLFQSQAMEVRHVWEGLKDLGQFDTGDFKFQLHKTKTASLSRISINDASLTQWFYASEHSGQKSLPSVKDLYRALSLDKKKQRYLGHFILKKQKFVFLFQGQSKPSQ